MARQIIKGPGFTLTLIGIPFVIAFARLRLVSERRNIAGGEGILIGPLMIAFVGPRKGHQDG